MVSSPGKKNTNRDSRRVSYDEIFHLSNKMLAVSLGLDVNFMSTTE